MKKLIFTAAIFAALITSTTSEANAQIFGWRCRLFRPVCQARYACAQTSARYGATCTNASWAIEYEDAYSEETVAESGSCSVPEEYLPEEPTFTAAEICLSELNAVRRRYGLRELTIDETLQEGAAAHCQNEARRGAIFHAQGCGWEITAQNYDAQGIRTALSQWLNSGPHAAILLGGFTRCGVASYRSSDGRNYCTARFE